jgi:hypothetical protein
MKEVVVGSQSFLPDGSEIRSKVLNPVKLNIAISDTAHHEATHAVVGEKTGTSVKIATITPGPGYGGLTELTGYNAIAAAAPHADGCDGTSYDMALVEQVSGSTSGAIDAAKATIASNREVIHGVASLLDEKGSANGTEIRDRIKRIEHGADIQIELITPDGEKKETIEHGIKGEIIMFPEILYPVATVAEPQTA